MAENDFGVIKNLQHFLTPQQSGMRLSGVFTHVQPETPYPYITLQFEGSKKILKKRVVHISVKIWSLYHGIAEINTLIGRVKEKLENVHGCPLEEGQSSLRMRLISEKFHTDEEFPVRVFDLNYQAFIKMV